MRRRRRRRADGRRRGRVRAGRGLVQHANAAVFLADAVRHLGRVHPHGQLVRQIGADELAVQAATVRGPNDQRVHLVLVDADATVRGAACRRMREPVVLVLVAHHGQQRHLQHLQLRFQEELFVGPPGRLGPVPHSQHRDDELHGGLQFHPHDRANGFFDSVHNVMVNAPANSASEMISGTYKRT